MKSEKDYIYEAYVAVSDLNEYNLLKPHGYQQVLAQVAEEHLKQIKLNIEEIGTHNLAWALVSLSLQIEQPVKGGDKLFAHTWYSKRKGTYFRREFLFKNEAGEVMFRGATFSILLDLENRSIFRKRELPFAINEPTEVFEVEATPSFKEQMAYEAVEQRKVRGSYIDCLGHVNNCRYGEFAYDAMTDEEQGNLKNIKRLDMYFVSELRKGESFSVLNAKDGQSVFIKGHNDTREKTSFHVIVGF